MSINDLHTDKNLLLRIVEGDITAYRSFFKTYYSALIFYATAIVANRMDAEDIVQDTFIKIWNDRRRLSIDGNLKSYIYTLVKNACLDKLRNNKKTTEQEKDLVANMESIHNEWENFALYEELLRAIIIEINTLPSKYQTILTMHFLKGKNYAQISKELQVPEATVRKQKERALKMLKNSFINRNGRLDEFFLILPFFFQALVTN